MKTLKCDLCEANIEGENFDAWFNAAHEHWGSAHAEQMATMAGKPKEEGEKWMAEAKMKFDAA